MTRIAIAFGLGLAWAVAACGGRDEAQDAAKAKSATEVTVDSAPEPGAAAGAAREEATQVTVESAEPGEEPAAE